MDTKIGVLMVALCSALANAGHPDHDVSPTDYPFNLTLSEEPHYTVHWGVDKKNEKIRFALNVEMDRVGWIGFGLSKKEEMVNSDVVTVWIDPNGQVQLQDRYARMRQLPDIDASQDWQLSNSSKDKSHVLIEMHRKLVTCDSNDIDITTDTLHLIWALGYQDLSSLGKNNLMIHNKNGSARVNLLGSGDEMRTEREDSKDFVLNTKNTTIPPRKTSYWCQIVRLPKESDKYIYKFGAFIPDEGSEKFVHHMLLYQCPFINQNSGTYLQTISILCDHSPVQVRRCRGAGVMAGWAKGGQDFYYPKNVAYKIGPEASLEYALLEIHYDNPNKTVGHKDNSGMRFFYTTKTKPQHRAGVMTVGYLPNPNMVIPPDAQDFTVTGICSSDCTKKFSRNGIKIFGGLLHTHSAGKTMKLRHFTLDASCGGRRELQPIDQNLNYDSDYQQVNLFPKEVTLLPGDDMVLQCSYNTRSRTDVTLGGEGTLDEMCLTFLFYYPYQNTTFCTSMVEPSQAYQPLRSSINDYTTFTKLMVKEFDVSLARNITDLLKPVKWNPTLIKDLQRKTLSAASHRICLKDFGNFNKSRVLAMQHPPLAVKCHYNPTTCGSGEKASSLSIYIQILLAFFTGIVAFYMHYHCL